MDKNKFEVIDTLRKVLDLREKVFGLQEEVSNLKENVLDLGNKVLPLQKQPNLNRLNQDLCAALSNLQVDIEELRVLGSLIGKSRYQATINRYKSNQTEIKKEKVHPTKESLSNFMENTNSGLILEKNQDGDFWIIEENDEQLLFPAYDFRISKHNINVVNHFFRGEGFDDKIQNQFSVEEPALLEMIDVRCWKLQKEGKLIYTQKS